MDIFENLEWLINRYGVVGVFVVSMIGNAIPYSTTPYLLFIIIYSGLVNDPVLHVLITLSGGVGAAIGKLVVYYFGYGIRHVLPGNIRENMEVFIKLFKRSTFIAVLVFAASPLPDDIIYVPLGATRYDVKKYFIALVMGKTIITGVSVYFGSAFTSLLSESMNYPSYAVIPALILLTLYIMYLVAKINWVRVAEVFGEKGFIHGVAYLLLETFNHTLSIPREIYIFLKKLFQPPRARGR